MGWELSDNRGDSEVEDVRLLLPVEFPNCLPRVALPDASKHLVWPHVEVDGVICLENEGIPVDANAPINLVRYILQRYSEYRSDILTGDLAGEFSREFVSYWDWAVDESAAKIVSILNPRENSSIVFLGHSDTGIVIGETKEKVENWLKHRYPEEKIDLDLMDRALFLRVSSPLIPPYPQSVVDLIRLLANESPELWRTASELLELRSGEDREFVPAFIVLVSNSSSGAGIVALSINRRPRVDRGGRKIDTVPAGFRPGKLPERVRVLRTWGPGAHYRKHRTRRADRNWIHGRDNNVALDKLAASHVLMLGAGSLGSGIAVLLAQAGVGKITIFDPDHLGWENLSRHALGSTYVGYNKAEGLCEELNRRLPHIEGCVARSEFFSAQNSEHHQLFESCDIAISTTGDWNLEAAIARMQQSGDLAKPIVFSWLETHALAAHAVLFEGNDGILVEGFSSTGDPKFPVLTWDANQEVPIPACGGQFAPYGAVSLAYAQAMSSELVLEYLNFGLPSKTYCVFIQSAAEIQNIGGKISDEWKTRFGEPDSAQSIYRYQWP